MCPSCGYCQHCGRGGYGFGPGFPSPYHPMPINPIPVSPWYITTTGTDTHPVNTTIRWTVS